MTDVFWLEQTEADAPANDDGWLSANESVRLQDMRFAKRRADWRLGRWTAKRAVAACLRLPSDLCDLAKIEVRAAPSGAPEIFVEGGPAAVTISLSHRAGRAMCAVTPAEAMLGCDLELIEPRSNNFIADYFTVEEQALVARTPALHRPTVLALLWSAKESALKALHEGLRLDTRSVAVTVFKFEEIFAQLLQPAPASSDWHPLQVRYNEHRTFHGWWQHMPDRVRTLVAAPPTNPPVLLHISDCARAF